MSSYELVPEELFERLPQDPHDKFVMIVREAQANLARLLDETNSSDFVEELRSQFISTISSVAEALGIVGLPELAADLADYRQYQTFQVHLAGVVAKVRLQGQLVARPHSVELGRINRARIQQEIDHLRAIIESSELPENKKAALRDKLIELEEELGKQRLSFARTMAIAAAIMGALGGGATALANAPKAAETVTRIIAYIGEDKEKEEEERLRLAPPPKALPNYAPSPPPTSSWASADLDDDIPF
jgi:hypothetical protein